MIEIHARWFSANGTPLSGVFDIGSEYAQLAYTTESALVAVDDAHNMVITWTDADGEFPILVAQTFDEAGNPVSDPILLDEYAYWISQPVVAMNGNGDFVVAWLADSMLLEGSSIHARVYDVEGTASPSQITVSVASPATQPAVAIDDEGRFAIAWTGQVNDFESGIAVRWYDAVGDPLAEPLLANSPSTGSQVASSAQLAANSGGRFIATWSMQDNLVGTTASYLRAFDLDQRPTLSSGVDNFGAHEDDAPKEIDLEEAFSDANSPMRDWLTYEVISNSNESLVTAIIDGGTLTLTYAPNQSGEAEITIRATDWSGAYVEDSFDVTVDPVNDAPVGAPLPSFLVMNGETFSIDLKPYFTDIDDDAEDLDFSYVSTTNGGLFTSTPTVIDGVLSGTVNEDFGSAVITVRAADPDDEIDEITLIVGAYTPSEDLEENGGGGALLSVPWGMIDEENIGSLVSDIIQGLSNTANSTDLGIAIYQVATSLGTAEYSLDGGDTWQAITVVSATSALLLSADADTRVRFRPNVGPGAGGAAAGYVLSAATSIFSYVGWDMSSGTAGQTLNLAHQGNQTTLAAIRSEVKVQQTMASMDFVVNTTTSSDQFGSHLAMAPDGRSVIAWYSDGPQGKGVYAQRFNADGTRYRGEVLITSISSSQLGSTVVRVLMSSNSSFVVATRNYANDNAQSSAEIKRFNWNTMEQIGNVISFSGVNSMVTDADMNNEHLVIVRPIPGSSEPSIMASVYDASTIWQKLRANIQVNASETGIVIQLTTDGSIPSNENFWQYIIADAVRLKRIDVPYEKIEYAYDFRDRLVEVREFEDDEDTTAAHTIKYGYDVLNRRVAQTQSTVGITDPTITRYVYDGQQVAQFFTAEPGLTSSDQYLLWGPGGQLVAFQNVVASGTQPVTTWTLTDHEGTVRDLIARDVNSSSYSRLVKSYSFGSFGSPDAGRTWEVAEGQPSIVHSDGLRHIFVGQEFDRETGLQYGRSTYYDSLTGRYVSQSGGETNPYQVAGNSPLNDGGSGPRMRGAVGRKSSGLVELLYWAAGEWQQWGMSNAENGSPVTGTLQMWMGNYMNLAARVVDIENTAVNVYDHIEGSYRTYAGMGIGTWNASMLMFNPVTSIAEAITGESYQAGDFGHQLDWLERSGRGILGTLNTAGTALGGVVGLRSFVGVKQITHFGQIYQAGINRTAILRTILAQLHADELGAIKFGAAGATRAETIARHAKWASSLSEINETMAIRVRHQGRPTNSSILAGPSGFAWVSSVACRL